MRPTTAGRRHSAPAVLVWLVPSMLAVAAILAGARAAAGADRATPGARARASDRAAAARRDAAAAPRALGEARVDRRLRTAASSIHRPAHGRSARRRSMIALRSADRAPGRIAHGVLDRARRSVAERRVHRARGRSPRGPPRPPVGGAGAIPDLHSRVGDARASAPTATGVRA